MIFRTDRVATGLQLLLGLLAGATVAGFAGSLWWLFDLFSHFRVQYFLSALLLIPALWMLARRWSALVCATVAAVNLVPIAALIVAPTDGAPTAVDRPLHVVSANVFVLNSQHQRFIDYVRREQPDVLVVLEVTESWARALGQLEGEYPFRWIHAGDHRTGIAVLSRYQPVATREIDLAGNGHPSLLLTLEHGGRRLSLLGVHLYWPLGRWVSAQRNRELTKLAQIAAEHSGSLADALVIVGDFNITPFSAHFQRLLHDGQLRNCARGHGLQPTWPTLLPPAFIQIDHCLATRGVQIAGFRVGEFLGSDHYPLVVDIR